MNEPNATPESRRFFDRLTFYHPTASGNGSAFRLSFHLRRPDEDRDSCFFVELASQKTVSSRSAEGERIRPTFDWAKKMTVKLGILEACEWLTVLEGRCDQVRGGKGLYHESSESTTILHFRRQADPPGVALDIVRKSKAEGGEVAKGHILFSEAEAIALRLTLQQAIGLLCLSDLLSRLLYSQPEE